MSAFWKKLRWFHVLAAFAASIVLFVGYLHIYTLVLGLELPKTMHLRHKNEALVLQAQMLDRRMDMYSDALEALEVRDEEIYRSIFGLNSIPASVRNEGIPGMEDNEDFNLTEHGSKMRDLCRKSDVLKKKAYIQSKSYDEIDLMLYSADQMATSIPAIWPVMPDKQKVKLTSHFGWRSHPVLGYSRPHEGIDLSMKSGSPVYATGDGVVESVKYERGGYGHHVIINHGFGYKTFYAHCKAILVAEGIKVKRGEQIAESGNSGLTSGAHLHYEVRYKGRAVNPLHYFDFDMSVDQYKDMIKKAEDNSEKLFIHPSHLKK